MKKRFTFNYQPIFRLLNDLLPRQWNPTQELKLHSHSGTVSCAYAGTGNKLSKNLIQNQQKQQLFLSLRIFLLLTLVSSLSLPSAFATTFPCNDVSYRLQGNPSALYKVDLETGDATLLFAADKLGNRKMTALGYSPEDGFLYAYQSGTNDIIQIHNDGGTVAKDITGLPSNVEYNAGEISKDGVFYLYRSGDPTMQKVDISARTTSTLTLSAGSNVGDISISADAKYIYGISTGDGQMVTYNASSGARTLTNVGIPAMTTSTYIDKSGNLFFINDANSTVYQVTGPNSSPDTESGVQISAKLSISITNTDGARCTNAFVPLQPTFTCNTFKSYLFQGDGNADGGTLNSNTSVYEINIVNGSSTQVHGQLIPSSSNSKTSVNNVGFNVTDSYLWGFRRGTSQLVRMGSDWSVSFFSITGLPSDVPFNAGDIDANGVLYLYRGHQNVASSQVLRVDINPASSTYLTLLSPLTLAPVDATREMIDLAINPVDGHLYGINATTGNLLRINSSTGAVSTVGATTIPIADKVANAFGACYFDNAGTLYVSQNGSGKIYRIPKAATSATGIFVSNGPVTADNDGARCFQQPITELSSLSGNVFDDGNALTDNLVNKSGTGSIVIDGTDIDDDVAGNQPIYATLVNSSGAAVTTVPVLSTGTYSFLAVSPGTYSVVLSTNSSGSTTASLPASWNNTGEHLGAGSGNDGTVNGKLTSITVGADDVTDANFGINKKPDVNDATLAAQPNPGGTNQAPVASTAFTGNDLEDGTYPTNLTGRTVALTPANNATLYYNGSAVSTTLVVTSFDPTKVTIDPNATGATSAGNHPTFTYSVKDNAGVFADPATVTVPFTAPVVSISGNVFDDGNGLTDNTVNKFGASSIVINGTDIDPAVSGNQPIYVTLVNSSNVALATVQVSSTGTYTFTGVAPGNYTLVLTTNVAGSTSTSLPASWTSVGEKLGTGTGSDGSANGTLTGITVASSNITDANFGINKKPDVNDATVAAQTNPGGTVQAPVSSTAFTGTDLEDGTYTNNLTGRTVILTPATNGTLYYSGTAVSGSTTINSFDPTKVTLDPNATGATSAGNHPTFTYSVKDNAGVFADPATVTVPFTAPIVTVSLSGSVLNDGNGLTDNLVNKFGASSIVINGTDIDPAVSGNQPIYVTLINSGGTSLTTVQVSSTGTYTFNGVAAGTYSVVLSTNSAGSTSASLPTSWTSVGEHLGTGTGSDAAVNGILTGLVVASSNVTDANFGINKKPDVNDATVAAQVNPGGTNQAPVASTAFTGSDLEDGTYTNNLTGRTVILTPATNATLYYSGTAVSGSTTINSFDPTKVTLDPTATGATTGSSGAFPDPTFTYSVKDNAGVFADPATVTVPFTAPTVVTVSLSGNVLNDGNGLTDNLVNKFGTSSIVINGTDIDPAVSGNQPIYVTLVNSGGTSLTTVQVSSTGTYTFNGVAAGTYSVVLSTNSAGSTSTSLPASWTSVGEHLGTGTGSDAAVNGILTGLVVASSNVTDANFGIDKKPVVNAATVAAQVNPGGTNQAPVASTAFTGSDLEDGTYTNNLTGRTVILTPATNATLYYSGTAVSASTTIASFDPTKVTIDPNATGATTGSSGAFPDPTFTYSVKDNAGVVSDPKTVTVPFTAGIPDLAPIIYAVPATQYGTTNFTVVIDVYNLLPTATSGLITLFVTKDPLVKLSFNPSSVFLGNKSVQNNIWTLTENDNFYILKTTEVIDGEGLKSFGFTGILTPGNTRGTLTISTTIVGGSGGEVRINNNSDADKIDYFKK